MNASRFPRLLLAVVLSCTTAGSWAVDIQSATSLAVGHSDNIRRTAINTEDDTIAQAELQLSLNQDSNRLKAQLAADLAYADYLRNTYDSELLGSLSGQAVANLIEDRLQWTLLDNFGQTQRSLFTPVTPENRENINYLATGPDLMFHFGDVTQARLSGRYTRVDYEFSPYDSNRFSLAGALARSFSETSSLSLNAQRENVNYSQSLPGQTDFNNSAVYAAYSGAGRHTRITFNVGTNQIDNAGVKSSAGLIRFSLSRDISARSTFSIGAGQDLTDVASVFGTGGFDRNVSLTTQSLGSSNRPYKHRFVSLSWDATGRRTRIGASATFNRELYIDQSQLDLDRVYGEVHLWRDLGPRTAVQLLGTYSKDDYKSIPGDSDESGVTGAFIWRLSGRLRMEMSAEHYNRRTEILNAGYVETRYWLQLRFGDDIVKGVGPFSSR